MPGKGKRIIDQVLGIFDYKSTPMTYKQCEHLIRLGNVEETDLLGVTLHKEARNGTRKTLKKILKTAICVDYPNDCGQTPLFCACARDNEPTALLLLEYGANPNEKSQDGMTPCHAACYMGNIRLLGKLIEAGGDMRLHDNDGNGMREWAIQNPDPRKRAKMLIFLDRTHVCAMAYSGDSVSIDKLSKYVHRPYKQTSLMEIMKMRTGSDSSFENLKRVQSMGFGKVYLGNDRSGGIISVVPLITEAALFVTDGVKFNTGYGTYMEEMEWMNVPVSLKQVKQEMAVDDGIDLLIAEAEYLGRLRHPNILLLMGICQSTQLDRLMLVFECVEQASLHHLLHHTTQRPDYTQMMSIINNVCSGMNFIHNQNLMHCGLSSMAVYLVSPHITKVGNLEFMVERIKADLGKPSQVSLVSHSWFLYNWMAPELMKGMVPHFSSDVYSFCCIVWEIFAQKVPWADLPPEEIKKAIVDQGKPLSLEGSRLPGKLKSIVGYGLELREENRLNKFSLICNWLKSDHQPKFQRTFTPLTSINKSDNFRELLSTSSPSSSLVEGTEASSCDSCSEDRISFRKGNENSSTIKPGGNIPASSSCDSDMAKITTSCLNKKKTPSEGDLCKSDKPLQNVSQHRPPSDVVPRVSLQQRNGSLWTLDGRDRSNNGKPYPGRGKANLQDQSHKLQAQISSGEHHNIDILDLSNGHYRVKRLAERFQEQMNQHRLRQAILKGSKAPRGSCPDLESSVESGSSVARSLQDEYQTGKDKSDNKTTQESGQLSRQDARKISSNTVLQNSSKTKSTPCTSNQATSDNKTFESLQIFYTMKTSRDVGTSWNEGEEESTEFEHGPSLYPTSDQRNGDTKSVARLDISDSTAGKKSCNAQSDKHQVFLEEIKQVHRKLFKSYYANVEQSPGVCYCSPTVEINSPNKTVKRGSLSPRTKLLTFDSNFSSPTANEVADNIVLTSSPKSQSQSAKISLIEPVIATINPQQNNMNVTNFKEDDSFWTISPVLQTEKGDGHSILGNLASLPQSNGLHHSDRIFLKEKLDVADGKAECSFLKGQTVESGLKRNTTEPKSYEDNPQVKTRKASLTGLKDAESVASLPEMTSKRGACSSDAVAEEEEPVKNILNSTFTVVCEQQGDEANESFPTSSSNFLNCVSVDSIKIGQWIDHELEKITKKMELVYTESASEQPTDTSSSGHRLKDVSLSPTSESNPEGSLASREVDGCGGLKTGLEKGSENFEKSSETDRLLKIDSAKSVSEADGCIFEFQEFYIDDDFDSAERIQRDLPCSKLPLCDCNVSTRHAADKTNTFQMEACSVKEKATFFTARLTNIKPPVFPRWPRRKSSDKQRLYGNQSQSALTRDEEEPRRVPVHESASERVTFWRDSSSKGIISSMKELAPFRGRTGVPSKPKTAISANILQCGRSDPSVSVGPVTREVQSQGGKPRDEDDTLLCSMADATTDMDVDENSLKSHSEPRKDMKNSSNPTGLPDSNIVTSAFHTNKAVSSVDIGVQIDCQSETKFMTRTSQTSLTRNRAGKFYDSDSVDSDLWVKNKLRAIQAKIQRRRAREHYDMSSDGETISQNDQEYPAIDQAQSETDGRKNSAMENSNRTESMQSTNSVTFNVLGNKEAIAETFSKEPVGKASKTQASSDQAINQRKELKSHGWTRTVLESSSLKEVNRLRYHERSFKPTNQESKTYQSKSLSCTTDEERNGEECTIPNQNHDFSDRQETAMEHIRDVRGPHRSSSIVGANQRDSSGLKMPDTYSTLSSDRLSVKPKVTDDDDDDDDAQDSNQQFQQQQLDRKKLAQKSEDSTAKGKQAIDERPSHPTTLHSKTLLDVSESKSSFPSKSSSPLSQFKFSASNMTKSRVISFQESSRSDISTRQEMQFRLPPKQSNRAKKWLPDGAASGASSQKDFDSKFVKTWLDRQNFGQNDSLTSIMNTERQSITSRIMAQQNETLRQASMKKAYSKWSTASGISTNECVVIPQPRTMLTLGEDSGTPYQHETVRKQKSTPGLFQETEKSSFRSKKTLSLSEMEEPKSRWICDHQSLQNDGNESTVGQDDQQTDYDHSQGINQTSSISVEDHCLTLNLKNLLEKDSETVQQLQDGGQKMSHLGLHRFYIPRERWPDGCQARLNVQISPTHPDCHRVTTVATDPRSGHTETLLDQMVITNKLRSTIQID